MPLEKLLFTLLALTTAALWWRVWGTRPTRRPRRPGWGTRLERRLTERQQQWCVLCGKVGHTAQEHVRVPQSELGGIAAITVEEDDSYLSGFRMDIHTDHRSSIRGAGVSTKLERGGQLDID